MRDLLPFAEHTLRGDYSPRHSHGANGLGHSEAAAMARSREEARAKLREMSEQRKSIEEEMEALTETLNSTGAGVRGKLVDAEGFPRADIDVHQTLIHRSRMAGEDTLLCWIAAQSLVVVATWFADHVSSLAEQSYRPITRTSWRRSRGCCLSRWASQNPAR